MTAPGSLGPYATMITVAIIALAFVGCGSDPIGEPTSGPTATAPAAPSAATMGGPIPAQLQSRWIGGHRDVPGIPPPAGSTILFSDRQFALTQANGINDELLRSSASAPARGQLHLELSASGEACQKGDLGVYDWSLSSTGRTLTVTAVEDVCATRRAAVPGVWWKMGCKNPSGDVCLGDLDAGTYKSQFIGPLLDPGAEWEADFGAVTYTVPDGWANSSDYPRTFSLVPSGDYANVPAQEVLSEIRLFAQPVALSQKNPCSVHDGEAEPGVGRTVDELIAWLHRVPGLRATDPTSTTIDGHPGRWVDLTVAPGWTGTPECDVLEFIKGSDSGPVAIAGVERERLILLDLGQRDVIGIRIWSWDPARFDAFVAEAMPIVESFQFE